MSAESLIEMELLSPASTASTSSTASEELIENIIHVLMATATSSLTLLSDTFRSTYVINFPLFFV